MIVLYHICSVASMQNRHHDIRYTTGRSTLKRLFLTKKKAENIPFAGCSLPSSLHCCHYSRPCLLHFLETAPLPCDIGCCLVPALQGISFKLNLDEQRVYLFHNLHLPFLIYCGICSTSPGWIMIKIVLPLIVASVNIFTLYLFAIFHQLSFFTTVLR